MYHSNNVSKRKKRFWVVGALLVLSHTALCVPVQYSEEKFAIKFDSHLSEEGILRLPKNLKSTQKVPLLLVFGGFENAAKVLDLIHPEKPIALATFNYPFHGDRKIQFPESLKSLPEARLLFQRTLFGIQQSVALLIQRNEIDPNKIIILGASFGAHFAVAAAEKIEQIKGVAIIHGFGRVPATIQNVILRSWIPRYGWISRPVAWFASRLFWWWVGIEEPENSAQKLRANQAVLMIIAEHDSFIPAESSTALLEAFEKSSARLTKVYMPGDHLQPGSDELIHEITQHVQNWVDRNLASYPFSIKFRS